MKESFMLHQYKESIFLQKTKDFKTNWIYLTFIIWREKSQGFFFFSEFFFESLVTLLMYVHFFY